MGIDRIQFQRLYITSDDKEYGNVEEARYNQRRIDLTSFLIKEYAKHANTNIVNDVSNVEIIDSVVCILLDEEFKDDLVKLLGEK